LQVLSRVILQTFIFEKKKKARNTMITIIYNGPSKSWNQSFSHSKFSTVDGLKDDHCHETTRWPVEKTCPNAALVAGIERNLQEISASLGNHF
jgi:hypothetical protein